MLIITQKLSEYNILTNIITQVLLILMLFAMSQQTINRMAL